MAALAPLIGRCTHQHGMHRVHPVGCRGSAVLPAVGNCCDLRLCVLDHRPPSSCQDQQVHYNTDPKPLLQREQARLARIERERQQREADKLAKQQAARLEKERLRKAVRLAKEKAERVSGVIDINNGLLE